MNKLTVSQRLALGFGILLMCTVLTTLLGIWQLHTASRATQGIIEKPLAKERLISDWYLLIHSAVRRTTAIAKSTDPALATFFAEEQKASAATVTALQQQVDALMESNAERALFAAISDVRKTYSEARDEVIRLKRDGHPDEADRLLEQRFIPAARTYQNKVQELVQMQRAALDGAAGPIRLANEEAQYLLAALGLFGTLIGVAAAALIARSIVRPLQTALQAAQHVAQGDLTSHAELAAHGADEPAQLLAALAEMRMALTRVIQSIHRSTEEIVSASTQVAAGSGDLAERTSTTSAHLQDTSEAMSRLNATVEQAAESARTATTVAEEAARVATDGGAVVSRAVAAMDEVNASSQRIADITGTIDSIAFQTNILALNAAVEAARAGEQGRGFAVVASEVRSLAQRSAAAAREIKDLIQGSVEQVQTGTTLVQSAGATMEDIVSAVHRVSQVVSDIAGTARLQSERIESVNHAIGQLEQIAQQNTVLVEELSTSSSRLRTQAGDLSQSVSTFRH